MKTKGQRSIGAATLEPMTSESNSDSQKEPSGQEEQPQYKPGTLKKQKASPAGTDKQGERDGTHQGHGRLCLHFLLTPVILRMSGQQGR